MGQGIQLDAGVLAGDDETEIAGLGAAGVFDEGRMNRGGEKSAA